MTEEDKNEKNEQAEAADAPQSAEAPEAADAEAPAEEAPAAGAADEAAPEEAPDGGAAKEAAPAEAPGAEEDEFEGLDWKAKQRLLRSRESGEAGPERGPDERSAERDKRRGASAAERRRYRAQRRAKHQAGTGTPPAERRSAGRKERQGTVISDKADKTITVRIDTARRHPTYEKIVRRSNTLRAHDERNEANRGDVVRVVETRPLSRHKRWRLVEVVEKAK